MSDTAAFLAGCAVTGVAVLFVMRNDGIGQTKVPPTLQSPTPGMSATPFPSPSSDWSQEDGQNFRMETELDQQRDLSRDLSSQLGRQQDRTEDLKGQLEQQQRQTEDLKSKLEKQERSTDVLIAQIQEQQRLLEQISDQPMPTPMPIDALTDRQSSNSSQIQTMITGAVGIVVVIVVAGGGLILFAIIVVVLAASNRRRPARTVHIVHPFPRPYPTLPSQPLLPTRARSRSARHVDVEYYTDEDYD